MKKVEEIMQKNIRKVPGATTLKDAHNMMQNEKLRHLVITNADNVLEGIVSDRDVKRFISPFVGSAHETAQDRATLNIPLKVMSPKTVCTCKVGDDVKQCLELMLAKSINCVPIVDEHNKVQGVVTSTDLLKHLLTLL